MDAGLRPAPIGRAEIITTLHTALDRGPAVLAAFLGGSDATGRTDGLSDIDLVVVVEPGAVEATFTAMHIALGALSPISHRWRLPEPTWHGHAQEFLALRDAAPAHFVDVVVEEPTGGERFLDVERHGTPLRPVRPGRDSHPEPLDEAASSADRRAAGGPAERFPLFQTLVTRAVRRGFIAEAAVAYQDHAYRPLIELLRIRHCPHRFDYGARYLDRDLPAPLRARSRPWRCRARCTRSRSSAPARRRCSDDPGGTRPRPEEPRPTPTNPTDPSQG